MLRVIIAQDQEVRDAFLSVLSLERFTEEEGEFFVYKREKWILIFNEKKQIKDIVDWTLENYVPERLYLPFFGESIDIVHEVGDIILPNVFLTYDPHIQEAEIYKENRDKFLGSGHFLEIFNEQKDYYVEDYGLSVGGIVVDSVPEDTDVEKLMLAYEADIYVPMKLDAAYQLALSAEVPIVMTCGIIRGKLPKNITLSPLHHTVKNMVGTFQLLEDE